MLGTPLARARILASVFRHRNYAVYTGGNAVSLIGTWMQRIATGWLAWELTGSGAWLGLLAFADLFPTVIVGPIAGAAADRWSRLTLTRITQLLGALQALALVLLLVSGLMNIWFLLAITLFHGVNAAFNMPARLAIIHSMVPRTDLGTAVAINSIVFNMARFIGPALAGLLIVTGGVAWAYAVNAVTFLIFLGTLMLVRLDTEERTGSGGGLVAETLAGMRYAASHTGIAAILLLMLATGMGARPVAELLPGFAADVYQAGAGGLAIMSSSIAIGAMAGGFWLGSREAYSGLTGIVIACSVGMALSVLAFAAVDTMWLAIPALVAAGFFMVSVGVGAQTLVQLAVDGAMRGRVLSLHGLIFRGSPAIGALGMGVVSDVIGLPWSVALGCLALLVFCVWVVGRRHALTRALETAPEHFR